MTVQQTATRGVSSLLQGTKSVMIPEGNERMARRSLHVISWITLKNTMKVVEAQRVMVQRLGMNPATHDSTRPKPVERTCQREWKRQNAYERTSRNASAGRRIGKIKCSCSG